MDQYLTTYKKDYPWPSTRNNRSALSNKGGSCLCDAQSRELKVTDLCGDDYDWSGTGPMGRLLDPKLYPAKTGPHPESEATKFDQPNAYMKKLEEKYPNLYGIMQSTPMDEIILRVDQDRLRTTYQIDYSENAEESMDSASTDPCASIRQQKKVDCRPSTRSPLKRGSGTKDEGSKKKKSRCKDEEDSQETRLPSWRSEYQDNISRLGQSIMRSKIHHKKAQESGRTVTVT